MDDLTEKNKRLQTTYNEKFWDLSAQVSPDQKIEARLNHQNTVKTILSEIEGKQGVKSMMDTNLRKAQLDLRKA